MSDDVGEAPSDTRAEDVASGRAANELAVDRQARAKQLMRKLEAALSRCCRQLV
jgi:hypothetical protein